MRLTWIKCLLYFHSNKTAVKVMIMVLTQSMITVLFLIHIMITVLFLIHICTMCSLWKLWMYTSMEHAHTQRKNTQCMYFAYSFCFLSFTNPSICVKGMKHDVNSTRPIIFVHKYIITSDDQCVFLINTKYNQYTPDSSDSYNYINILTVDSQQVNLTSLSSSVILFPYFFFLLIYISLLLPLHNTRFE